MYSWHVSGATLVKCINVKLFTSTTRNLSSSARSKYSRVLDETLVKKIGAWFKQQRTHMMRIYVKQMESIVAIRLTRRLQLMQFYTRMWEEYTFKEFINSWRTIMCRKSRRFLLSSVGVAVYNWDCNRIKDTEIHGYINDNE